MAEETRGQLEARIERLGYSRKLLMSANLDLKKQLVHSRLLTNAFRNHLDEATAARIEKAVEESRKENPHDLPIEIDPNEDRRARVQQATMDAEQSRDDAERFASKAKEHEAASRTAEGRCLELKNDCSVMIEQFRKRIDYMAKQIDTLGATAKLEAPDA